MVFFKKDRLYIQAAAYREDREAEIRTLTFEEALPKIECEFDTEGLPLSKAFWGYYLDLREIKEPANQRRSPQSLETKAVNNLKTLIKKDYEPLRGYQKFITTMLEDILDFGTLPDFTLRRIANLDTLNKTNLKKLKNELDKLQRDLGVGYLDAVKADRSRIKPEIIIAIENQKP